MKLIRILLLPLLLLLGASAAQAEAPRVEKVVYHFSDNNNPMQGLRNIRNHLNASPKAQIVVVALSSGIDFLLDGAKDKNGNPYDIVVQELAARNVQFRVCNNTLTGLGIGKDKVLPEATIVPSGVAEISRLQSMEGYAYIKP
ncbi:DsrE family protein [Pseudoduganella sp. OTU4001]|uniref:DsrE family protein n=1 Tax=Pseudoduganella sp. OTU4001 TaxID=3043854 RepID=UPI00313DA9D2